MLRDIPVDEITRIISLATAPAFLLGAIAGLLSLLVGRLARISDLIKHLNTDRPDHHAAVPHLRNARRRIRHTYFAIACSVHSGIATGWMVVLIFVDALFGFHDSRGIAIMFIAAMVLFTAALFLFLLEIGLAMADIERENA